MGQSKLMGYQHCDIIKKKHNCQIRFFLHWNDRIGILWLESNNIVAITSLRGANNVADQWQWSDKILG